MYCHSFKHQLNMKYILSLLAFCFFLVFKSNAQTRSDVKLYGYVRPVTGGAPPRIMNKESNFLSYSSTKEKFSYMIYLEGPSKLRIYPVEMYIKGQRTGVKAATVVQTPVEIKTGGNVAEYSKTVTLVPKTSKKVYHIDASSEMPSKGLNIAKVKAETNELVVVYKYGGKFYYAVQKKLIVLEPIVLQ